MPCKLGTKLFQESVNVWDIEKSANRYKTKIAGFMEIKRKEILI